MVLFNKFSIKNKIISLVLVSSTLAFILGAVIIYFYQFNQLKADVKSNTLTDAKLIGEYCALPLKFDFPNRANEIISGYKSYADIETCVIYDKDNSVFAKFSTNETTGALKPVTINSAINIGYNSVELFEPIVYKNVRYGTVYLKVFYNFQEFKKRFFKVFSIALAVMVFVSFILASSLQSVISRPIRKLTRTASDISKNDDYSVRVESKNQDEIGLLYHKFNRMMEVIQDREIERDKAVKAFVESEENFKNIFNNSTDGIILANDRLQILEVNESLCEALNFTRTKLLKLSLDRIFSDQFTSNFISYQQKIIEYGKIMFEETQPGSDNRFFPVEVNSRKVKYKGEDAYLFLIRDITERKKALESIRKSEESFRAITENSPDYTLRYDKNCKHLYVSKNVKELTGLDSRQFLGKDFYQLGFPLKVCDFVNSQVKAVFASKEISEQVFVFQSPDKEVTLDWRLIPEYDQFGEIQSVLTIARDITLQKLQEEEIINAKIKAEESDRLKSAFLANMSHEIRTPMNGIIGFSNLLREQSLTDETKSRYIDIINNSSKQLLSIINDIIDISKIEAGQVNVLNVTFNLNEEIVKLYNFFKAQADEKGISLHYIIELQDENSSIYTDRVKINQVFSNLLSNAIKFTKQGEIVFGYHFDKKSPHRIKFFVKDTGIGISQEDIERVFERFRQVEYSATREYGGTGLGLSITKAYVKLLGGEIQVKSEVNQGSLFSFVLPFKMHKNGTAFVKKTEFVNIETHNFANKTFLVVEDEDVNYMFLKELLETKQANIVRAKDGREAVKLCLAKNNNIDIVLMDIKMPTMNGYDATREIKKVNPKLPIIAQTAYALVGDEKKAHLAGCDDYIAKPIKKEELLFKIQKFLDQKVAR